MITKNANLRAEWSEVFSYEIRNGELYRTSVRDKTPKNTLKRSFTLSETTNTNSSGVQSSLTNVEPSVRILQQPIGGSDLIYNPRQGYNNELRSTYTEKSPFR